MPCRFRTFPKRCGAVSSQSIVRSPSGFRTDSQTVLKMRHGRRPPSCLRLAGLVCRGLALLLACVAPARAQSAHDQCADRSPTQAALTACLDAVLSEAERDLAVKA